MTDAAAARGLRLAGLGAFDADGTAGAIGGEPPRPSVVVGYGAPPGHRFEVALAALVASVQDAVRDAPAPAGSPARGRPR